MTRQLERVVPVVPSKEWWGMGTVAEVMTANPRTVTPKTSLREAAQLSVDQSVSGLPVVDGDRVVGMVSHTDLLRLLTRGEGLDQPVETLMTPLAFTVKPATPITRAASLMAWEGVHRVIVVDDAGALVGIVSALDIARWVAGRDL